MINLKFIDGVLHQSIQMQPGGPWTDYNPVPSEGISQVNSEKKEQMPKHPIYPTVDVVENNHPPKPTETDWLEEKLANFLKNSIYGSALGEVGKLASIARQHFAEGGK